MAHMADPTWHTPHGTHATHACHTHIPHPYTTRTYRTHIPHAHTTRTYHTHMRASSFLLPTTLIILFSRFDTQASGVAEPKLLRELFQEAEAAGWPIMQYIRLENMVTVVDSSLFTELYMSDDKIEDRPELGLGDGADDAEEDAEDDIPDWMTGSSWAGAAAAQGPSGGVVQLLTEQVEIADVLVANKASSHKFSQVLTSTVGTLHCVPLVPTAPIPPPPHFLHTPFDTAHLSFYLTGCAFCI